MPLNRGKSIFYAVKDKEKSRTLIANNLEAQQQKRTLIERRMKRVNLTKSVEERS